MEDFRRDDRRYGGFYLWAALAFAAVAFWGFSYTYFGPVLARAYPEVSPWVHVHGWSFFLWYALLTLQAGLIAARRVRIHRRLGLTSLALAVVMVFTGILVLTVRFTEALDGKPGFPWLLFGLGILATLILFSGFYATAILNRKRPEIHKRAMIVASSAGLGAAVFRIFVQVMPGGPVVFTASLLSTNVFIIAGMIHDWVRWRKVHRIYVIGLISCVVLEGTAVPLAMTDAGQAINRAIASLSGIIGFLY